MRRLVSLLILLLSLPLVAAAGEQTPSPRAPGPDEALVVFYRIAQPYGGPRPSFVNVNRTRPVQLGMAQHTWLYMKPGDYVMGPRFPEDISARAKLTPATFTLQAGKTHYFPISSGLEIAQEYPVLRRSVLTLEEMPAAAARAEMDPVGKPEWRSEYRPPEKSYARLGARAE